MTERGREGEGVRGSEGRERNRKREMKWNERERE